MDKLKYIKLKNEDGSYTDSIPLAVDSNYVDVNGTNLTNVLNSKANIDTVNTLSSRIDSLAHLEEGSTTGDAELIDGRVSYDNFQYSNIGNSIRDQVGFLNNEFYKINAQKDYLFNFSNTFELGNITITNSAWTYSNSTTRIRTIENTVIQLKRGDEIYVDALARFYLGMRVENGGSYTYTYQGWTTDTKYTITQDCEAVFLITLVPETTITSIKDIFSHIYIIRKNGLNEQNYYVYNNIEKIVNGNMLLDSKNYVNSSGLNSSGATNYLNLCRVASVDFETAEYDIYIDSIDSGYKIAYVYKNNNSYTMSNWITESLIIPKGTIYKLQIAKVNEVTTEVADINVFLSKVHVRTPFINSIISTIDDDKRFLNLYTNFIYGTLNSSTGVIQNRGNKRRIITELPIKFDKDIKLYYNENYYLYVAMYNNDMTLKSYVASTGSNIKGKQYIIVPKDTFFRICIGQLNDTSSTEISLDNYNKAWFCLNTVEYSKIANNMYKEYLPSFFIPNKRRFILHRGNERVYTENSIPAFESGAQIAFGIETDVRETSDGYLVCMHDYDVDRTTNGTGNVADLTLAEIRSLTINNIPEGMDAHVPTFEEYLSICKKYGCIAIVEIKTDPLGSNWSTAYEEYVKKIINTIKAYGMEQSCVIMNFREYFGYVARRYSNLIHVVYLRHDSSGTSENDITESFIDSCVENSSIAPSITTFGLNSSIIQYAHSKNHLIIPYGIGESTSATANTWFENGADVELISQITN